MKAARVSPFSNGTQYTDWTARNCDRCAKPRSKEFGHPICPMETELSRGCISDGTISKKAADRIGYTKAREGDGFPYTWDCPERQEGSKPRGPRKSRRPLAEGQQTLILTGEMK